MKEETAQESSFWSIFKDYYGRWYSANVIFVSGAGVCIIILLLTAIVCMVLALISAFMHTDLNSTIVALGATNTGLAGTGAGIFSYNKNKATKLVFNKEIRNKEIENAK